MFARNSCFRPCRVRIRANLCAHDQLYRSPCHTLFELGVPFLIVLSVMQRHCSTWNQNQTNKRVSLKTTVYCFENYSVHRVCSARVLLNSGEKYQQQISTTGHTRLRHLTATVINAAHEKLTVLINLFLVFVDTLLPQSNGELTTSCRQNKSVVIWFASQDFFKTKWKIQLAQ